MVTKKKRAKKAATRSAPAGVTPELQRVLQELRRFARMDNARGHELAEACAAALGESGS